MKLAAIYNVWDATELLHGSIKTVIDSVDLVIIVYQTVSNFGEEHDPIPELNHPIFTHEKVSFSKFIPDPTINGTKNERNKRNFGLDTAKQFQATHFIHMDCDEYYLDFATGKQMFINSGHKGSVVKLHTYFKHPTLRLENPESYFVPFIHELRPDTECTRGKTYPFFCDPTRRINEMDVIELPIFMHHYSWVRKDINRKIKNSSARDNIAGSTFMKDYNSDVKPGFYVEAYKEKLVEVDDYFDIGKIFS